MSKATRHIKTREEFWEEVEKDWAAGRYDRFYPPDEVEARVMRALDNLVKGVGSKPRKSKKQ